MRVQIITKDNGLGLSHDYRVLRDAIRRAIPDAEIALLDWQRPEDGKRSDINIFLELLNGAFAKQAPRNIYIPNPEWYFSHLWGSTLPAMTEVWAKTRDCERIFRSMHGRTMYSGWTSEDIRDTAILRKMMMIHVAGGSSAKGTAQVLSAADGMRCPMKVVSREPRTVPDNVEIIISPSDAALRALQNEALIHLCPSSYEGYGHYINEARACGAFVVTTNAPPMNELVDARTGAGVATIASSRQNLAMHHHADPAALQMMMEMLATADEGALRAIGAKGRARYEAERSEFHEFVINAIAR